MDRVVMKNVIDGDARFTVFTPITGGDAGGVLSWIIENHNGQSLLREGTALVRDNSVWVQPGSADYVVSGLVCAGIEVWTEGELEGDPPRPPSAD